MKILVAIANYGTQNDAYLHRVLDEYRSMPHEIDFVVVTNVAKDLGKDVEVKVGLPTKNPWSLPFAHKQIFADQLANYDLFIYSEDDILISNANIQAFLAATRVLKSHELAGFLRIEKVDCGDRYFCDVFDNYHWVPESVVLRGGDTFAFFTNLHSACYVLTKDQLKRSIDSGGFLVAPHADRYDLLCSAATDPYTGCGFTKLICASRLEDFVVHHLSNKYVGKVSLNGAEFDRQIQAIMEIGREMRPAGRLFVTETKLRSFKWSKSYYERFRPEIFDLIPPDAKRVLSFGCGWGDLEYNLVGKGIEVVAVPLDTVISACVEAKGIQTICGEYGTIAQRLSGLEFDCLYLPNVLHLIDDPPELLSSLSAALAKQAKVIASVPNLNPIRTMLWHYLGRNGVRDVGNFEKTGIHSTSRAIIKRWFRTACLKVDRIIYVPSIVQSKAHPLFSGPMNSLLASELIVVAEK